MYFTFNQPLSSDQPTTIKNTYVCHSFFLDMFLIRRFSLQLPCALTYRLPMETPVSYTQREEPGYRCTVNLASNCWALRTSGVAWMVPTSLVYLPVQVKHKNNPISQSLINPFNWEVHGESLWFFLIVAFSNLDFVDVNECEDKDLCHPHMCQNMMGSYKCRCSHGYQKLNETSNLCIGR